MSPGAPPQPSPGRTVGRSSDAHPISRDHGFQIVRGSRGPRLRPGDLRDRRAQWLRQVERRRRHPVGDGRAEPPPPARAADGRHHLRWHGDTAGCGHGRGRARARRLGRTRAAGVRRFQRDPDRPPPVSIGGERVPDQPRALPATRRDRLLPRHGRRYARLHDRRAGADRVHRLDARRPPASGSTANGAARPSGSSTRPSRTSFA
jgi:hypothetical protein